MYMIGRCRTKFGRCSSSLDDDTPIRGSSRPISAGLRHAFQVHWGDNLPWQHMHWRCAISNHVCQVSGRKPIFSAMSKGQRRRAMFAKWRHWESRGCLERRALL